MPARLCVQTAWAPALGRHRELLIQPCSHPGHHSQSLVSTTSFRSYTAHSRPLLLGSGLPGPGRRDARALPCLRVLPIPPPFSCFLSGLSPSLLLLCLCPCLSPHLSISVSLSLSLSLSPFLSRTTSHRRVVGKVVERRVHQGRVVGMGGRRSWKDSCPGCSLILWSWPWLTALPPVSPSAQGSGWAELQAPGTGLHPKERRLPTGIHKERLCFLPQQGLSRLPSSTLPWLPQSPSSAQGPPCWSMPRCTGWVL